MRSDEHPPEDKATQPGEARVQNSRLLRIALNLTAKLPPRGKAIFANLALLASWIVLYRAVYPYLGVIFTRQEFRTNQVILVGVALLLYWQVRRGQFNLRLDTLPQLHPAALALVLGSSVLYLANERFLGVNTLSASLFGLGTYGLLGLWMTPIRWRKGLIAALLLIGALPFGEHMQTFIGYPVRLLTASVVGAGLAKMGVHSLGIDTILVFESGLAQVDLPCSGVKSLWTGGLFLLAATWIEARRLDLRWFTVAFSFSVLLLLANLVRVAILVVVGQVAGWRLFAEMLHVPLGVLGFAGACGAAVLLLRRFTQPLPAQPVGVTSVPPPTWLIPLVAGLVLGMALLYAPRPHSASANPIQGWSFSPELQVEPWPFTPSELEWLSRDAGGQVERWRFRWRELSGSMLLAISDSWRSHHRPESCFEVYGLSIENAYPYLAAPDLPVRLVSLGDGKGKNIYSAAYWFQSADIATEDYAARIWADLAPDRQPWVLVTLVFDDDVDLTSEPAPALYRSLRQSVQLKLEGDRSP
ncbi:MAG: exosortase O [Anaerolineales bacterium]|jgi:exosortase O